MLSQTQPAHRPPRLALTQSLDDEKRAEAASKKLQQLAAPTDVTTNGPSPGAAASAEGAAPEEAPTEAPWPFLVRLTLGFVFLRFSVLLWGVSLLRSFERFTAAYQRSASSSNVTIIATRSLSNEVVLFPFKIYLGKSMAS